MAEQVELEESLKEIEVAAEVPSSAKKPSDNKQPASSEPNADDEFKEEMERMYMQREDKLS